MDRGRRRWAGEVWGARPAWRDLGPGEGFGPWGGRGGGRRERMERGVLRYLILDALRDGPRHGYEIIKWLEDRTHGWYAPSPGTVYPTLQLLEDLGFVRAEGDQGRRVHHLTDAGRAELEANAGLVEAVWARFAGGSGRADQHEIGFLRDEAAELMKTAKVAAAGAFRAGDTEKVRQIRRTLERCKNEIREIVGRGPTAANSPPEEP